MPSVVAGRSAPRNQRDRFGKKTDERGETAMNRPTFHDFKKKALSDPDIRAEHESLSAAYHLRKKLIGLRKKAGLTQEELAKRLHCPTLVSLPNKP
jgi:DNA-binding transcriptional regulator YiaG